MILGTEKMRSLSSTTVSQRIHVTSLSTSSLETALLYRFTVQVALDRQLADGWHL